MVTAVGAAVVVVIRELRSVKQQVAEVALQQQVNAVRSDEHKALQDEKLAVIHEELTAAKDVPVMLEPLP